MWESTTLGDNGVKELQQFFIDEFNTRIKFAAEVTTLPTPGQPGTGGRIDLLFYVHDEDVMKFATKRFKYGMRWWEDVIPQGGAKIYPKEILNKYPVKW